MRLVTCIGWALVALVEDGASSVWEQRYTLHGMGPCQPITLLPGTLMLRSNVKLCLYDLQTRELTNACESSRLRYRRHGLVELEPLGRMCTSSM